MGLAANIYMVNRVNRRRSVQLINVSVVEN